MSIDFKKAKATREKGVLRLPDGRLLARASLRLPDGKIVTRRELMPEGADLDAAKAAVLRLKNELKNPPSEPTPTPLPRDTQQTVEQYCVRWLEVRARRLSPSTAVSYTETIADRLLPRLGWMACKDVTRQAVESWVVWIEGQVQPKTRVMRKNGRQVQYDNPHAGALYRQDTMRKWWRCAKTVLGDMAADLNMANPVLRVRQPERPDMAGVREQRTLDADGTGDLLAAARERFPQHFASVAVMAMTGMRAGEVFGLQWDCVDFDQRTITVRRAISRGQLLQRTKTKAQRVVPLHPELAAILLEHRQDQIAKQHPGLETGLLFPSDEGKPRMPSSLRKVWPTLQELTDTKVKVGSQVLRRSLNTQLVMAGVDRITTRAILGHTSEAMTQRYAGISPEAKAEAVDKVKPRSRPKLVDGNGE